MLRKMLRLFAERGVQRTSEVARELGISTALAQAMLETLIRQGYLHPITGYSRSCSACPLRAACSLQDQTWVWGITEKGQKFLANEGRAGGVKGNSAPSIS